MKGERGVRVTPNRLTAGGDGPPARGQPTTAPRGSFIQPTNFSFFGYHFIVLVIPFPIRQLILVAEPFLPSNSGLVRNWINFSGKVLGLNRLLLSDILSADGCGQ